MRTLVLATALLVLSAADPVIKYPETKKLPVTDDYFGTPVGDPYRWLEDDNSADTRAWVDAQNRVTFAYLDTIPQRARIRARLGDVWNYERYSSLFTRGGRDFYERNDGLQNQDVLYVAPRPGDAGRVLLDPNTLSADGTVALSSRTSTPRRRGSPSAAPATAVCWSVRR